MHIFAVWSPPKATQRWSGPRHASSDRELCVECATGKSLENHRKRSVFSVHHRCTGAVTILCCARVMTWGSPEMYTNDWIIDEKTDQKSRDMWLLLAKWGA